MRLNDDFSKAVAMRFSEGEWIPSPEAGVNRRMLHRVGVEKAIATSIVEYLPGSSFPTHKHPKGEELFVLEGVFSDESGDYPAGTYVRNPDGSGHAPKSEEGTIIFVKLRQFQDADDQQFSIKTKDEIWLQTDDPLITLLPLHRYKAERAFMLALKPGATWTANPDEGFEILVIEGSFSTPTGDSGKWDWFRSPVGQAMNLSTGEGVTLFIKAGHF